MADQVNVGKNDFHLKSFYNNIMKDNALLYKYQFIVELFGDDIDAYGLVDVKDPSRNLTYYVKSANIPGYSLETGKTTFLGTEFRVPGVLKYDHNWKVKILLEQNLFAYKALQTWRRAISRLEIDGGGIKTIPNVYARVSVLSADHQYCVNSYILEGLWIKSLSQITLRYATNGGEDVVSCDVDFRYQYSYPDPNFSKEDPLDAIKKS